MREYEEVALGIYESVLNQAGEVYSFQYAYDGKGRLLVSLSYPKEAQVELPKKVKNYKLASVEVDERWVYTEALAIYEP